MSAPVATATHAETLTQVVAEAVARARVAGHEVIASVTLPAPAGVPADPLAFFARGAGQYAERVYWERPAEGLALVGLGAARTVRTAGAGRFADTAATIQADLQTAVLDDRAPDGVPGGPRYLGGFAFDPAGVSAPEWAGFLDGLLVLPRYLLTVCGDIAALTISVVVEPRSDSGAVVDAALAGLATLGGPAAPGRHVAVVDATEYPAGESWRETVTRTAADVRAGVYEKVVLARTLRVTADAPFDTAVALGSLREAYPSAYIFAVALGESVFLGATPELLVRLSGREVEATCLAGSIARGATPEEDERLARALLDSTKDQTEHQIVARAIQEALAAVCDDVYAESTPRLMRVRNVQHLYTPMHGRLAGNRSILDLVERLHPTPAVGGYPREAALAAIREREGFDRGWYAGPVGWVDRTGSGEFAVALRSALVDGARATLYAGGGIMGDSTPDAEYAETALKLRPMLTALGNAECGVRNAE